MGESEGFDLRGLTDEQVTRRTAEGLVNRAPERTSRSIAEIARAHVFTRFNGLLGVIAVAVLATGRWQDALFVGVLLVNAVVGASQEVRAKRTLDAMAVLHAPRARVRRGGSDVDIDVHAVVRDDVVLVTAGDQIVVDGVVGESEELEVDESLLTGEADPIVKQVGDPVLSGSFVVAGSGVVVATAVGAASYAHGLAAEARRFALTRSELREGTDRLLRWISWIVLTLGPLLVVSELRSADRWQDAVTGAAAGVVGMVPEGLVLLTTLAFLVAVASLARRQVLGQELAAVEGLARVDVVCLDKTGTLTEGSIAVADVWCADGVGAQRVAAALGALAAAPAPNATAAAIARVYAPADDWELASTVPFSSARKWSAAHITGRGWWVLGAPDVVLQALATDHAVRSEAARIAAQGRRVVALAHVAGEDRASLADAALPADLSPMALVVLDEQIRTDAADTLAYLVGQGVALKVISGDHPLTVAEVARRVGVAGLDEPGAVVDARTLLEVDDTTLRRSVEQATVFGRVAPHQKQAMVRALQAQGHVVAMTGDGVNDALALKDADLGVAMGSGAAATRAVAQLVLLDGRFSHLPEVLAEGRRVIANVERVATLFVVKNVMSALLSIATIISASSYPMLPRHLSLLSTLTIGIPAFLLALAPNSRRYVPGFLSRVMRSAVPWGVTMALGALVAFAVIRSTGVTGDELRAATLHATMMAGLVVLAMVARPWRPWKLALVAGAGVAHVAMTAVPATRDLFALSTPGAALAWALAVGACASVPVVALGLRSGAVEHEAPARRSVAHRHRS